MSIYRVEDAGVNVVRVRPRIDLVVEVRSRPTEAMWEAMRAAEIDY
jgi:late competence protein required for DNA uptake (superfamily II DNA/RNA helicase)